ncbi:hypothetical protein [Luteolibacter luteus]|uniref:HEAT repeat domain-containing protein n=1 Tax=Luteolibacter luteus TaxID=2728835 RepID=A0A858RNE5_9BACT|nr:hypothetical protein [Luteolibacter luteus]QJE98936.1 hypothetical protein HHL09_25205 [Luteolibacter luteus]
MIARCLLSLLAVLSCSCGEREKQESRSTPELKAARATRPVEREHDDPVPDAKAELRGELDAALKDPDGASRQQALEKLAWDAIDVDPDVAREAFEQLEPDSEASRKLVAHFAMRLADEDPEKAIAWAQGLEQSAERTEAFGSIAVVIAARDPERGAALVMAEMPEGKPHDRALVLVSQRWVQVAPEQAAEWVAGLPEGAARKAGLHEVISRWLAREPLAAATWIEARPEKGVQMAALAELASMLRNEPEEKKEQILSQFRDVEIRRKTENLLAQPPP